MFWHAMHWSGTNCVVSLEDSLYWLLLSFRPLPHLLQQIQHDLLFLQARCSLQLRMPLKSPTILTISFWWFGDNLRQVSLFTWTLMTVISVSVGIKRGCWRKGALSLTQLFPDGIDGSNQLFSLIGDLESNCGACFTWFVFWSKFLSFFHPQIC